MRLDLASSRTLGRIKMLLESMDVGLPPIMLTETSSTSALASSSNPSGKSIFFFRIFWNVR